MNIYLILDESSVSAAEGVSFHLNQAVKHPENPLLLPGEPHQWDSLQVSWPATVLHSPSDQKFRCWYAGLDCIQTPQRRREMGYAESTDGIHWQKPELGQVTFLGHPTNRIQTSWDTYILSLAFENPLQDAPESQRFGGYWIEVDKDEFNWLSWRKALAWSPDGKTWTRHGTAYEKEKRIDYQDICQLVYDSDEPDPAYRIKGYTQMNWDVPIPRDRTRLPHVRVIGLVHGASFDHVEDAPDPIVLAPEPGIDEEIHFCTVSKIGDKYLMLFESDRFSKNPIHGDLRLAVSDDGRKFRRVHPRQAVVSTGPRGTWDENLLVTTCYGMQVVGDEIYIFYVGCPNTYNSWPAQYCEYPERRGSMFAPAFMGLATLPRDRYAYAAGPGILTTQPLSSNFGDLWLNADGDDLSIIVSNSSGERQGRLSDERSQTVYRKVIWDGTVPTGETQLRITLNAGDKLYSLKVK